MKNFDPKKIFKLVFYLTSAQSAIVAFFLTFNKSRESGLILGLSASRIIIVLLLFSAAFLFFILGKKWGKSLGIIEKIEHIFHNHGFEIMFLSFWLLIFLCFLLNESYFSIIFSPLRSFDLPQLYSGIRPVLILGTLLILEFSIGIYLSYRNDFTYEDSGRSILYVWFLQNIEALLSNERDKSQKSWMSQFFYRQRWGVLIWLGMIVLWFGIAITKIGIIPDDRFWNIAGVPILAHQITFVVFLILFLLDLETYLKFVDIKQTILKFTGHRLFLYSICFAIWIVTIVAWNAQDLRHTYFAPGPYPPNYERYPFSDAATFDVGSQYFLLGRGLNNHVMTDRPFLMMFLSIFHLIGGQNYETVIFVQILLLALIPVFLFILGWRFHSRTAGIGIAILGIVKEKNAILSATQVSLANAKVLSSEMLSALLLIVLTTLLIYWLEKEEKIWPILAGGILGISIGVRVNSIFLIPVVLLVTFLAYRFNKINVTRWFITSILFIFSIASVIASYSIENIKTNGAPFWYIKITQAYDRSYEQDSESSGTSKNNLQKLQEPFKNSGEWKEIADLNIDTLTKQSQLNLLENFFTLTLRHFVHNEVMTLLIYPTSFQARSLDEVVEQPFWSSRTSWMGQLEVSEIFIIGLNLIFISLGIGYSISRWKITGLIPLIIHLSYNLTSAGARTSGGRYIVPVDWVIHLYFIFGVIVLVYELRNWNQQRDIFDVGFKTSKRKFLNILLVVIGLIAFGSSFLLSALFQPEYPISGGEKTFAYFRDQNGWEFEGFDIPIEEVETFYQSKQGFLALGVTMYPRFFGLGESVDKYTPIQLSEKESMLYFRFLSDQGPRHVSVILSDRWIGQFPNAKFAVVLGCDRGSYIEGKVVLPLDRLDSGSLMSSNASLICD